MCVASLPQVLGDFQMGVANAMSAPYVPNWVEITRRTLRQAVEKVCKRWNVAWVSRGKPGGGGGGHVLVGRRWMLCEAGSRRRAGRSCRHGGGCAPLRAAHGVRHVGLERVCSHPPPPYLCIIVIHVQGRLAGEGMQLPGEAGPLGDSDDEGEGQIAGEAGKWCQQQASPTASAAAD